ncbi:hypothetical protein [Intrasporangium oryzae]|uniref:hypothetical protein n=1 Tax=Intrasporangium oryzae TaxID=412687 RepID=UPI0012FCA8C9|nr:hypothetical protein [Intrasporangium oryzae]
MTTPPTTSTSSTAPLPATARPVRRAAVPWATVLPLAVALAYADGFWVTSLRGAVGAVGRGQGPFSTWWRESSVLIPVYVCAVIGALALAMEWSRRRDRSRPSLAVVGLLVVVAGTLVGVAAIATGAASDYHVQSEQVQMMASMRGDCRPDCIERLRQDTLWLQVRATGMGAALLLVTNLGVLSWVTMFRGGRLDAVRWGRPPRAAADGSVELRRLLALTLVGSALIHVLVMPEHLYEWVAAGLFFIALAAAQLAAAGLVMLRPGRVVLLLVIAGSAATLLLWAWTRLWGLPIGPGAGVPEPVGVPDVCAGLLELVGLGLAMVLPREAPELRTRDRGLEHLSRLAVVAVLAVLVMGVAATQPGWFDVVQTSSMADSGTTGG